MKLKPKSDVKRVSTWSAFLLAGALVLGCAGLEPAPAAAVATQSAAMPVWPAAPAQTRIRYLRSVRTAQDWGITPALWQRLMAAITGASDGRFVRPAGVAEQGGVLYVADPGAHALWLLDAAQNQVNKISRVGTEELASPVAVALRPDGAVYVADSRLQKVFLLDRSGALLAVAAQGLQRPAGLAFDAANQRLYVADSAAQKISVFGPDAKPLLSWGEPGKGEGQFNYPTHLALDASGKLLVNDALNFRLQAFDGEGHFLWQFGKQGDGSGDLAAAKGIAADSAGNIFVVDALFDAVQIFDAAGRLLLGFGERGEGPGQFWLPAGLFINANHELYVADAYNRRVQVFSIAPNPKEMP